MSVRTYATDETCPVCGVNILEELRQHVYEEGGRDFEYECPSCEHMMYIEVEPVPAFSISTIESSPTPDAADLAKAAENDITAEDEAPFFQEEHC